MALTPTSMSYSPTIPLEPEETKPSKWQSILAKLRRRDDHSPAREKKEHTRQDGENERPNLERKGSRKVVPSLPRPGTFRRQQSELRERLEPVHLPPSEKRAMSVDRRRARALSAIPAPRLQERLNIASLSGYGYHGSLDSFPKLSMSQTNESEQEPSQPNEQPVQRPAPPPSPPPDTPDDPDLPFDDQFDDDMRRELEERWILNLSMHFRDRSPREKFFVTYAESPNHWRRVTVSIDYRDAPPDSLERDLQALQYQRDKSARIYEAIRASLLDIQFYDTVTNLRLETSPDDRLHVHVTEDVNEIIQYPSTNLVQHLRCKHVPESEVHFDSHMSGFVYKVKVDDKVCIKKEIPGPDSVEEFLYEINALHELIGSRNVIHFEGLVVDEELGLVKGLLIGYAEKGPLVDLIYDDKGHLTWERRQKWANQIVNGLSEIHEAGYVQGDFTLSNIVIDDDDNARIIDINRRGCPVGWEPPEIAKKIESGQRISMYIGVKSDLFQLGMVLWAIAEEEDEPERQHRPLSLQQTQEVVPQWYRELAHRCLSDLPRDRLSARSLLSYFDHQSGAGLPPFNMHESSQISLPRTRSHSRSRPSDTQYIDPQNAVDRDDILAGGHFSRGSPDYTDSHTYIDRPPSSISLPLESVGSYIVPRRGRTPPTNATHLDTPSYSPSGQEEATEEDPAQVVPISPGDHRGHEITLDGRSFLINEEPEGRPFEEQDASGLAIQTGTQDGFFQPMHFDHVDSGLGDMTPVRARRPMSYPGNSRLRKIEHTDSGLADMDLAGVGENDALTGYAKRNPSIGGEGPEDLTIEEEPSREEELEAWMSSGPAQAKSEQLELEGGEQQQQQQQQHAPDGTESTEVKGNAAWEAEAGKASELRQHFSTDIGRLQDEHKAPAAQYGEVSGQE